MGGAIRRSPLRSLTVLVAIVGISVVDGLLRLQLAEYYAAGLSAFEAASIRDDVTDAFITRTILVALVVGLLIVLERIRVFPGVRMAPIFRGMLVGYGCLVLIGLTLVIRYG